MYIFVCEYIMYIVHTSNTEFIISLWLHWLSLDVSQKYLHSGQHGILVLKSFIIGLAIILK